MVHVAVGHQQGVDLCQLQPVLQGVAVGVRGKINQQFAVQDCLGAGAQVFTALCPGVGADGAGTEQGGPALGRGSALVAYFH